MASDGLDMIQTNGVMLQEEAKDMVEERARVVERLVDGDLAKEMVVSRGAAKAKMAKVKEARIDR